MRKKASLADQAIEAAFKRHGTNRQFNIFDLGKITKAGFDAFQNGGDVDAAVKAACDLYEQKS